MPDNRERKTTPEWYPQTAFLLAAGFGERMRPLSYQVPKPMLPLWGVPLIERAIRMLQAWGVRRFVVNTHACAVPIAAFLEARRAEGLDVTVVHEDTILGTGGALWNARHVLGDAPFWLMNTDIAVIGLTPEPFLRALHQQRGIAALWVTDGSGPRTVLCREQRVVDFACATPGIPDTVTFCGLHLVAPRIFDDLPPPGFSSIITGYRRAIARGECVATVCVDGARWYDLGVPERYLAAHRRERKHFMSTTGGVAPATAAACVSIGHNVRVGQRALLRDSVLMDNVCVAAGTRAFEVIAAPGSALRGRCSGMFLRGAGVVEHLPGVARALELLAWPVADVTLNPLGIRGSQRAFTRVRRGTASRMVVSYSAERPENAFYAGLARWLARNGIPVPRVDHEDKEHCVIVLDDLGDELFADRVQAVGARARRAWYRKALELLAAFRTLPCSMAADHAMRPPFGPADYAYERELFIALFARERLGLGARECRSLERELCTMETILAGSEQGMMHRDFQSSNMLVHNRALWLIDFQGMRRGPIAYDVASLLCDPYVALSCAERESLLREHRERFALSSLDETFHPAAIERLCQALGAFCRLRKTTKSCAWERYIPSAARILYECLKRYDGLPCLTAALEKAGAPASR